jgi:hypothetical protein
VFLPLATSQSLTVPSSLANANRARWTECERRNRLGVSLKGGGVLPGRHVPELDRVVLTPRNYIRAFLLGRRRALGQRHGVP